MENAASMPYTAYPPNQLCCTLSANNDVDVAGPIARDTDAVICANPFVSPSERRFGADAVTKIGRLAACDEVSLIFCWLERVGTHYTPIEESQPMQNTMANYSKTVTNVPNL
jgi:hypothetical protein